MKMNFSLLSSNLALLSSGTCTMFPKTIRWVMLGFFPFQASYGVCLEIFLNSILIETEDFVNGFIVLDTILDDSSYDNSCFSCVTSSNNNEIDAITWHTRLGHIG